MVEIIEMTGEHYDESYALWSVTEGMGLGESDSRKNTQKYLDRNPGTSFVALDSGKLVGTVMGGHDGRRGLLYHLAVDKNYRGQGIGRKLTEKSLSAIYAQGIFHFYIMARHCNKAGRDFWTRMGFEEPSEYGTMSFAMKSDCGCKC